MFEASLGIGGVNNQITRPTFSFRAGHDNFFLTARFIRSDKGANYIFQNSWLAGYRFHSGKRLNTTRSAGAGDISFVNEFGGYGGNILHEAVGLTFDAEVQWKLSKNKTNSWYLFANYYTTFNDYQNLNGFVAGISYTPGRFNKNFFVEQNKRNRERIIHNKEVNEKQRKLIEEKREAKAAPDNKLHWEMYAFAGTAKRPFNGGFGMFFEKKKIILGANFTWESQVLWKEAYHNPSYPPQIVSYHHFKNKQTEKAIFIGYRLWEINRLGLSVAAGPVWKKNSTLIGRQESYRMWYTTIYKRETVTGLTLQTELSYTFGRRWFGIGLIPFINIYKGYISPGGVVSIRFGFLR